MKKILINTFALIGFVTFILLACSVDEIADSSNNNNNNSEIVSNNYGKYQIEHWSGNYILVLNTETGEMRTYNNITSGDWVEHTNTPPVTFTH